MNTREDKQFISVEELCHRTGWDPLTIYEKANSGDIPGAVWGEILCFEKEKIEARSSQLLNIDHNFSSGRRPAEYASRGHR
jgi:hypothetical protein